MTAFSNYFSQLSAAAGDAWNRFWFTPRTGQSLARIRIGSGVLAFYTVASYWPDLDRFFGRQGLLPTSLVRDFYEDSWSALDALPAGAISFAYGATLVLLALLILGVGGRLVAILAAAATLSFFSRAPLVGGEFEAVLSMLLVYLCVGDASGAWSLGAGVGSRGTAAASPLNTISVRLIQIHVMLIHLMLGLGQLAVAEGPWWSGEGVWLAMSRPGMSLVDFSWLEDHPRAVAAWSHAMVLYLLGAPVLIWKPILRPLLLAAGVIVWLAFAVASGWTLFSAAMIVCLAAFLEEGT